MIETFFAEMCGHLNLRRNYAKIFEGPAVRLTPKLTEISFLHWKKLGKSVKKGEKAFLLWSKPIRTGAAKQKEEDTENELLSPEEEAEYKYYGIAYLFSNAQVEDISKAEPTAEAVEEPELPALMY